MNDIFYRFFEIATWTKGPEDIPRSSFLLGLSLAGYLLSGVLLLIVAHQTESMVLIMTVDMIMLVVWLRVLLGMRELGDRFAQTLTAIFGTSTLIHLVYLPPASTLVRFQPEEPSFSSLIAFVAQLVTLVWHLMINAHILHRALDLQRSIGVVLAFAYFVLDIFVKGLLLPAEVIG